MWIIWLILCGVFILVEIFTISFLFLWPGIGAFIAFLSSLITDNIVIQLATFVISTILLIIFTKPLVKNIFKNMDNTKMNKDSIIGKTAVVVKDINKLLGTGQVKVNGELWSAFCEDEDEIILKDSVVTIKGIEGVKLNVVKIK